MGSNIWLVGLLGGRMSEGRPNHWIPGYRVTLGMHYGDCGASNCYVRPCVSLCWHSSAGSTVANATHHWRRVWVQPSKSPVLDLAKRAKQLLHLCLLWTPLFVITYVTLSCDLLSSLIKVLTSTRTEETDRRSGVTKNSTGLPWAMVMLQMLCFGWDINQILVLAIIMGTLKKGLQASSKCCVHNLHQLWEQTAISSASQDADTKTPNSTCPTVGFKSYWTAGSLQNKRELVLVVVKPQLAYFFSPDVNAPQQFSGI